MNSRSRITEAICVLTLLTVSACASQPHAAGDPVPSATASVSPPGERDIVLAIAGDVHFTERTLTLLDEPASAFGPVAEIFSAADHAVVNLETAVTGQGTPEPKQFLFRAPAAAFEAVEAAGIDMVSLANNHALDYGQAGFADTLASARAAGIEVIGAGSDTGAALAASLVTIGDTTIAYLAVSQVGELADTWMATDDRPGISHTAHGNLVTEAVRLAAEQADVVVVIPHWGTEGRECPDAGQLDWAARLSSAGADAIIGTHAHLLQGQGYLGETYVAYGTGNFVWWRDEAYSNDTGVVQLTIKEKRLASARFLPARIDDSGRPVPVSGGEAERITSKVASLRGCAGLSPEPN